MTPNPVPSIPSREEVEALNAVVPLILDGNTIRWNRTDENHIAATLCGLAEHCSDLLAEVERMRKNWASSQWTYDEANSFLRANDQLRAEVERLTDALNVGSKISWRIEDERNAMRLECERLRATVSAQAAELEKVRDELRNISTVDPMQWVDFERDDRLNQFRLWAQNRARFALAQSASQMDAPPHSSG